VKDTLQRTANPKVAAAQYTGMASRFTEVDIPDKYTASLKSASPHPTAFDLVQFLNIGDKDGLEGPNAKTTAVGTRTVRVHRMSTRRPPHTYEEPKPLAIGQTVR
jgi:hypothetical protein